MKTHLRVATTFAVIAVCSMLSTSSLSALSVKSKPTAPILRSISSRKNSTTKTVNVIVSFQLPKTHSKAPLLLTQVKIGLKTCTAQKKAYTCLLKNVSIGREVKVLARSKNRNGFGSWSTAVLYTPGLGNKWTIGVPSAGNTPSNSPASNSPVSSSPQTGVSAAALKFNVNGAVGLALTSSVSKSGVKRMSEGSNLQAVNATGALTDAVSSGTATVGKFYIAPNNKLFVLFSPKATIGGVLCLLAEVDRTTGDPKCIDSTLDSIQWSSDGNRWPDSNPIQFDSSGSIYYVGMAGSSTVFRKYSSGVTTDLINDNNTIYNFLARNDGNIFVSGMTKSSNSKWLRRISSTGSLSTLSAGSSTLSLYEMPDNHIWMGLWDADFGIRRFNLDTQSMVDGYLYSGQKTPSIFTYPLAVCTGNGQSINYAFCGWDGGYVQRIIRTTGGNVFAVAGNGSSGILMRYYPTFSKPTTAVQRISVSQQVLGYVILSGTNASSQNITTLYNTATDSEQTLIPSSSEIEVYRLNYVASTNKIMFDGLRFSDNKYVIGQIDMNSGQVTSSQTGTSKLVDFQTFAS